MSLPPGPPLPGPAQLYFWIRHPTEFMDFCRKRYGPTFTLKLPPSKMVFLSDPEAIRTVFSARPDEMHAGEVNRVLRALVGDQSVLLLDRAPHMRERKLLMPSFHGERMRYYGKTMVDITQGTMATWPKTGAFSLHESTQHITLEVILRTVFGVDEGARLVALRDQIQRLLSTAEFPLMPIILFYLSEHPDAEARLPWRFLLRDRERTDRLLYGQIAERRGDLANGRKDVLSMLLQAKDEDGQSMTDVELRDELMTALAAGHETTATALAWAFERILSHPAIYQHLRDEIASVTDGTTPDPERLAALPYLDATVKEILRLRPVIPLVGRMLKKPFRIGGFDLPEGTIVAPCIYLAHRNPDVYPEPNEFRPERFLNSSPDPNAYLPLGGGVRRCIGAAFALYEMKVVLGTIIAGADLKLAQSSPARVRRRAITFWPEHGTRISAALRPALAS